MNTLKFHQCLTVFIDHILVRISHCKSKLCKIPFLLDVPPVKNIYVDTVMKVMDLVYNLVALFHILHDLFTDLRLQVHQPHGLALCSVTLCRSSKGGLDPLTRFSFYRYSKRKLCSGRRTDGSGAEKNRKTFCGLAKHTETPQ